MTGLTVTELDSAPVGAFIPCLNNRMRYVRNAEGWVLRGFGFTSRTYTSGDLQGAFKETLRLPATVRVWSWAGVLGAEHWSWKCGHCPDFEMFFADSNAAHDSARVHAADCHLRGLL